MELYELNCKTINSGNIVKSLFMEIFCLCSRRKIYIAAYGKVATYIVVHRCFSFISTANKMKISLSRIQFISLSRSPLQLHSDNIRKRGILECTCCIPDNNSMFSVCSEQVGFIPFTNRGIIM